MSEERRKEEADISTYLPSEKERNMVGEREREKERKRERERAK